MNRKAALLWRMTLYLFFVFLLLCIPPRFVEQGSLCIIYHLTGYRCPMCGMTRAFSNIMHFDILRGISFNYLSVILFPVCVFIVLDDARALISLLRGGKYHSLLERFWYRESVKKPHSR